MAVKKWVLSAGVLLLFSAVLPAQEFAEVFGGYSYVRLSESNMNGGSASVSFNPNEWLGLVGDFGGYHVSKIGGVSVDGTVVSYMFGPKLAFRSGRWTPFVQTLFGGAYTPDIPALANRNVFAMALGGGLDVNATKYIGIRVVQAEYFMTRFVSSTQSNARISAGVVFRF